MNIQAEASEALALGIPFLRGPLMALQVVIKLYLPLEKNIPLRSNYLFHHPETSKLEIKGAKHKRF